MGVHCFYPKARIYYPYRCLTGESLAGHTISTVPVNSSKSVRPVVLIHNFGHGRTMCQWNVCCRFENFEGRRKTGLRVDGSGRSWNRSYLDFAKVSVQSECRSNRHRSVGSGSARFPVNVRPVTGRAYRQVRRCIEMCRGDSSVPGTTGTPRGAGSPRR